MTSNYAERGQVKNFIEEHFGVAPEQTPLSHMFLTTWTSYSTDRITITCDTCRRDYTGTIKSIYAYIKDKLNKNENVCRFCNKPRCREAIEKYFEIINNPEQPAPRLTTNSTDKIIIKCKEAGHVHTSNVHKAYVNCTTNSTESKCSLCINKSKAQFQEAANQIEQVKKVTFEYPIHYTLNEDGQPEICEPGTPGSYRRFFDAKVDTWTGGSVLVELDGLEHLYNPKVKLNDLFKEDLAAIDGVSVVRLNIRSGKIINNLAQVFLDLNNLFSSSIEQ